MIKSPHESYIKEAISTPYFFRFFSCNSNQAIVENVHKSDDSQSGGEWEIHGCAFKIAASSPDASSQTQPYLLSTSHCAFCLLSRQTLGSGQAVAPAVQSSAAGH